MKQYVWLFLLLSTVAWGQTSNDPREMFVEAESYLLYEEYEEALPIYLKLLKADPTNDNLNYKVGLCYLNIPYDKEKAISYLEKAVQNINPNYKINNFKERQAPLDALFYLGNAYRINNQLDKALNAYLEFKKRSDPEVYDMEIVEEQIATVERAKRYFSKPIYFVAHHLEAPINSRNAEKNAVVSGDETVLAYNVKLPFYEALYVSRKVDGKWQPPQNIIPELGVDGDVAPTGLSFDGKEMIIYRNDNYDGNLYVSRYVNGRWTPIVKLNDKINTKYWESHGSLSPDGRTLYFTSNRKGGFGGLDIYTATRSNVNSNDWGNVTNMGPDINTKYNDESPYVSQDGKVLYFSSYGHFNMGGYDVFYSTLLDNGRWSAPLNMGYPLNTTDDDIYFVPVDNGNFAYITRYYPDSYGKTDIYKVELFSEQHPRKFILRGLLSLQPDLKLSPQTKLKVSIVNKASKDTVSEFLIDRDQLSFDTSITAGKYQMIVQGEGLEKFVKDFTIDKNQSDSDVSVTGTLKADTTFGVKTVIAAKPEQPTIKTIPFKQLYYKVFDNKPISILFPLTKGVSVNINILVDSALLRKEHIITNKENQIYRYQPVAGINILQITATLPDNTIAQGEILINYEPLADSLTPEQLAKEIELRMNQTQYFKEMLKTMAKTNDTLLLCLNQIDIDRLKLLSFSDLEHYIRQQAKVNGISQNTVDSLIVQFVKQQELATALLSDALEYLSTDSLHDVINTIQQQKDIKTVPQFASALLQKTEANDNMRQQLLSIASRLGSKADAYYYRWALQKVTKGKLKETIDSLDLQSETIVSGIDLLNYLIEHGTSKGYSLQEVYTAFFGIPLFTSTAGSLLVSLKAAAQPGTLKDYIGQFETKNISSIPVLARQLWVNCPQPVELLKLLIEVNDSAAFNAYMANLLTLSRGHLKEILSKLDLKEQNIDSPIELTRYLLQTNAVDTNQWITLNLYAASKNLIEMHQAIVKKQPITFNPLNFSISLVFILLLILILIFAYKEIQRNM
ncbi:MAG: hypothetical protein N2662_00210 [Bacteroidales bacterium]|nr:hypothetical protein [Bacteroidales bacterium]